MSLHMLFGLKVKHPSGLRLGHFFNRWDALQPPPPTHKHTSSLSNLSVFMLKRALKDVESSAQLTLWLL